MPILIFKLFLTTMKRIFSLIIMMIFCLQWAIAQDSTSVKKKEKGGFLSMFKEPAGLEPSPKKALLLSLAFPGAGQFYNKKQWYIRAPIAAGAVGTGVYFYVTVRQDYVYYRNILRDRAAGIPTELDSNPNATNARVREIRTANQKLMEQALFGTIIVYLLNGMEAFTTAHLINFDVSEDLSFKLKPTFDESHLGQSTMGVGLSIGFK
mgnify:CR=1 FL=1